MKIKVQIIIEAQEADNIQPTSSENEKIVEQIIELERSGSELIPQTLGLNMSEAKQILAGVQQGLLRQQLAAFRSQKQVCPHCQRTLGLKGQHQVAFRTLFGNSN